MLQYAAGRNAIAPRKPSPNALLIVISVHVALLAAVMSAKMDLPGSIRNSPLVVQLIPERATPPEQQIKPQAQPTPRQPNFTQPPRQVDIATSGGEIVDATPSLPAFDGLMGDPTLRPTVTPTPRPAPVKAGARLITPASELKPPYPMSRLASGEEGAVTVRLTVDERGRVTAVDPVGRPDRAFFEAARRHLLAHWRYQPATEDGRAVATSFTVTLRFQLDG